MNSAPGHSPTSRHDEGPPSPGPSCEASVPTESLRPASAGASDVVSHLTIGVLAGLEDDGHSKGNAEGCQGAVGDAAGDPRPSNTGVVKLDPRRVVPVCPDFAGGSDLYGWDWSATTHDGHDRVVNDLVDALGAVTVLPGKALHGWSRSVKAFDRDGYALGAVYFGAREDVHVVSTSSAADAGRRAVLAFDGQARTSRVDTRVDTLLPFDDLRGVCEGVAGQKAAVIYMESKRGGESTGRTLYVGAPSSAVRVRVYEKWLESPGQYVEGTNRVEVQVRPPSRAKEGVSSWTRAETFCASQLTRRLASELGTDLGAPGSLQKSRGTPDLEETLKAMGVQYGKAAERWLSVSGGNVDRVLEYLIGSAS